MIARERQLRIFGARSLEDGVGGTGECNTRDRKRANDKEYRDKEKRRERVRCAEGTAAARASK
jgi:hypothetical protein